jgi:hypothetical protein
MGQAEPGQLLPELGQQVVGEETNHPRKDVQHQAQGRLAERPRDSVDRNRRGERERDQSRTEKHRLLSLIIVIILLLTAVVMSIEICIERWKEKETVGL